MNAPTRIRATDPRRWIAAVAALLMLLVGTPAAAQSFPQFTGLVTDAANVLPADRKAALEQKLEALQQRTGHQLVVATIPDLQGYSLEDYGNGLIRTWGVGLKGADNGVILFIAPNEPAGHRGPRIEVGYGEEPVITDAFASVVINTQMMSLLKSGDVPGALEAGANALIEQLSLPDDQAKAKVAAAVAAYDKQHAAHTGAAIPFGLIIWLVIMGVVVLSHIGRRSGQRYYGGGGSNWPVWLWAASEIASDLSRGSGGSSSWGNSSSDSSSGGGGWMSGGFTGGGGGSGGGGGASGSW